MGAFGDAVLPVPLTAARHDEYVSIASKPGFVSATAVLIVSQQEVPGAAKRN